MQMMESELIEMSEIQNEPTGKSKKRLTKQRTQHTGKSFKRPNALIQG